MTRRSLLSSLAAFTFAFVCSATVEAAEDPDYLTSLREVYGAYQAVLARRDA